MAGPMAILTSVAKQVSDRLGHDVGGGVPQNLEGFVHCQLLDRRDDGVSAQARCQIRSFVSVNVGGHGLFTLFTGEKLLSRRYGNSRCPGQRNRFAIYFYCNISHIPAI
jgi:hypothetical protein